MVVVPHTFEKKSKNGRRPFCPREIYQENSSCQSAPLQLAIYLGYQAHPPPNSNKFEHPIVELSNATETEDDSVIRQLDLAPSQCNILNSLPLHDLMDAAFKEKKNKQQEPSKNKTMVGEPTITPPKKAKKIAAPFFY